MSLRFQFSIWISAALLFGGLKTSADTSLQIASAKTYTAEDIKALSPEDLNHLQDQLTSLWFRVSKTLKREPAELPDHPAILELGNYPLEENFKLLITVLRSEINRLQSGMTTPVNAGLVINSGLQALGKLATLEPPGFAEDLEGLCSLFETFAEAVAPFHPPTAQILVMAKVVYDHSKYLFENGQSPVLLNFEQFMRTQSTGERAQERLQKMEEYLRYRIIGQPEAVDLLVNLEWSNELRNRARKAPDAIYIMGPPGSGHDTVAEAFTDSLHGGISGMHALHMFRLPVMKEHSDLWQVLGSATGFVGSDNIPPFIDFLVLHSGGKYMRKTGRDETGRPAVQIVKNPQYKEGEVLPGYYSPESAVVFANQFHNWSRRLKDEFLKQALEKGYFAVHNPKGGESELYVPVRFLIASNEGTNLLVAREANGQRVGAALTYDEMLQKWQSYHHKKEVLKNEILATNGRVNDAIQGTSAPGISSDLLNLVQDQNLILLRPLSPADLQVIAQYKLEELGRAVQLESRLFHSIQLTFEPAVIEALQAYKYLPEANARPIEGKLKTLVEYPILAAIRSGQIPAQGQNLLLHLDLKENPDNTKSLIIAVEDSANGRYTVEQVINATLDDRPPEPLSDQRIEELQNAEAELNQMVFGIERISPLIARKIISAENAMTTDKTEKAQVIGLFGPSSVGKTQTAKAVAKIMNLNLVTFDFSQIQTIAEFKKRILGLKDADGNPIPSDFMKAYDRNNGRLAVAFDELANVKDPDVLRSLYDLLREPTVETFSDGKPRPMAGVLIIITGNAGQEEYKNVPRGIPMTVQMAGWKTIGDKIATDPERQRLLLERVFPEPLITRIERDNIFFIPPHTYKSLRQLATLKLREAIAGLAKTNGRRGYNVLFADQVEYAKFLDVVIEEGFDLRYQGDAISAFIKSEFEKNLDALLLLNKIPSGSQIILKYKSQTKNTDKETQGFVVYEVEIPRLGRMLELKLKRPFRNEEIKRNEINEILTAGHEAGHEIVDRVLFPGLSKPKSISIIEGIAEIDGEWVYYAGLATQTQEARPYTSREYFVRQIAVLAAGETAERLLTKGEAHSSGKENDMGRATRLAINVILRYGLSETWGTQAIPQGMNTESFLQMLSNEQRDHLYREAKALVAEGRALAERTLELNYSTALLPMTQQLAEKGILREDDLNSFYQRVSLVDSTNASGLALAKAKMERRLRQWRQRPTQTLMPELLSSVPVPAVIADIKAMTEEARRNQYDEVAIPDDAPIAREATAVPAEATDGSCFTRLSGV